MIGLRVGTPGVLVALMMGVLGSACTSARSGLVVVDGGAGGARGKDA